MTVLLHQLLSNLIIFYKGAERVSPQEIQEMNPGASVLRFYMYLPSEMNNTAKYVTEVNMSKLPSC
jgi:hypothetical protein